MLLSSLFNFVTWFYEGFTSWNNLDRTYAHVLLLCIIYSKEKSIRLLISSGVINVWNMADVRVEVWIISVFVFLLYMEGNGNILYNIWKENGLIYISSKIKHRLTADDSKTDKMMQLQRPIRTELTLRYLHNGS